MRLSVLPVMVLALSSLPSFAATKVDIVPTHPTNCAQANEINVMTLIHAASQEDDENLSIFAQFFYQTCANGNRVVREAPESEDRFAVLMKDGWRTPWSYRAPGVVSVGKSKTDNDPYVGVTLQLKKSEIFAEKSRREFDLVLTPVRGSEGYTWTVTVVKEAAPGAGTRIMIRPNF